MIFNVPVQAHSQAECQSGAECRATSRYCRAAGRWPVQGVSGGVEALKDGGTRLSETINNKGACGPLCD